MRWKRALALVALGAVASAPTSAQARRPDSLRPGGPTPHPQPEAVDAQAAPLVGQLLVTFDENDDGTPSNPVGTVKGVTFGPAWFTCLDTDLSGGAGCFTANEPSPEFTASMVVNATDPMTRVSFPEPVFEVGFWYSQNTDRATPLVSFYDSGEALLGTRILDRCGSTHCGAACAGDPSGFNCAWHRITFNSVVSIAYMQFDGTEVGSTVFDDLLVSGARPIPTFGFLGPWLLGILLVAAGLGALRRACARS